VTVQLRPWSPADAPALLAARRSTPDLSRQFSGVEIADEAQAADHIATVLRSDSSTRNWAVVEDGVAVGNVGLAAIEYRHGTAWAYYWLTDHVRGRGLAADGLRAVARWAFAVGLFRLELGHRLDNPASCRVATAAGFAVEGTERQKLRYGDERFDVETHARLATDPVAAARALPMIGG